MPANVYLNTSPSDCTVRKTINGKSRKREMISPPSLRKAHCQESETAAPPVNHNPFLLSLIFFAATK